MPHLHGARLRGLLLLRNLVSKLIKTHELRARSKILLLYIDHHTGIKKPRKVRLHCACLRGLGSVDYANAKYAAPEFLFRLFLGKILAEPMFLCQANIRVATVVNFSNHISHIDRKTT